VANHGAFETLKWVSKVPTIFVLLNKNKERRVPHTKQMKQVAVVVLGLLLALSVASCKNEGKEGATSTSDSLGVASTEIASQEGTTSHVVFPTDGIRIAWVNMDSLLKGYDYYFAMQREMEALTAQAEKELTSKGQQLQKRDEKLRNDVEKGLVTRSEAQQQAQELAQDQTRYLQLQESKRQQLAEEEQVRLRRVQDAIDTYIRKYNQEYGYHYILSVGLLYADPALSITKDVLQGLNADYAAQQTNNTQK
jgi:outer membrane chaperone skp (ompH)